ncbi:MAG: ATP-binding protein [Actinomycetota bacterium]
MGPTSEHRQLSSYHMIVGTTAVFLVVAAGLLSLAFGTVRTLQTANGNNEVWSRIEFALLEVNDIAGALSRESQSRASRNAVGTLDVYGYTTAMDANLADVRADLALLVDDPEIDRLVDNVDRAFERMADSAADTEIAIANGDAAGVANGSTLVRNRYELLLTNYADLNLAIHVSEQALLDEQESQAEGRLLQAELAIVPAVVLLILMAFIGRKIRRREQRLNTELRMQQQESQAIVDCLPIEIAWKDTEHRVLGVNSLQRTGITGWDASALVGRTFVALAPAEGRATWTAVEDLEQAAMEERTPQRNEFDVMIDGDNHIVRYSAAPLVLGDRMIGCVTYGEDVTEAREMERALATTGRMESIGQLAAGVAHEINTPVQFVSDNARFLTSSFDELIELNGKLIELGRTHDEAATARLADEADLEFLVEEVPQALAQSKEGLERVSEIVRAMKDFSHPGDDVGDCDLNAIIETTMAVSRNEWKYVADLELDLDPELPIVQGSAGRIKQVLLNMLVNAAHAIEDGREGEEKGRIEISTVAAGAVARITVSDDGCGMDDHVRERIFDQFFTTKEVGRGTGQGLTLAWDMVKAQGGTIDVASTVGEGTTFTIGLPFAAPDGADGVGTDGVGTGAVGARASTPAGH